MPSMNLIDCFTSSPLVLTEGAVGQRVLREFHCSPDPDIFYAALIYDLAGQKALSSVYHSYLQLAQEYSLPILLMTNTRRVNQERLPRSRYKKQNVLQDYTNFLDELRKEVACEAYIGGLMGCKGDAYSGLEGLSTKEAIAFHSWQLEKFSLDSLDFLFAGIMPTLPEATGMAQVMEETGKPYIISFTLRSNGTLLDGHTIHKAIEWIDRHTQRPPLCYMSNCIHPSILQSALLASYNTTDLVKKRFCGIQANAANASLEQLDNNPVLQSSPAEELAEAFAHLHSAFPLKIYGGCCGTDDSHLRAMLDILLHS